MVSLPAAGNVVGLPAGVAFTAPLDGVWVFSIAEANLRTQVKLSPENGPNPIFIASQDGLNGFLVCWLTTGQRVFYSSPFAFNLAGCNLPDVL